jgi:hypothetical protein
MGHWMVMPGLFVATDAATVSMGIAYNRALGAPEGHNHGIGPYVNPMSAEEVGLAGVRASAALQPIGETAISIPFEASSRMIVGAGFSRRRQNASISVIAQGGALYAPFTARGVADLSYAF